MRTSILLFLMLFTSRLSGVNTTILMLNNHPYYGSLDIHFVSPANSVIQAMVLGLEYVECAVPVDIPSSSFLNIEIYITGSDELLGNSGNVTFNTNTQYVGMILGESASDMAILTNVVPTVNIGNFKAQARHSIPDLQPVDFILRENNAIIGNDLDYLSISADAISFPVGNYILDITPAADNNNGLFAYELSCNGCDQQYIYFFLSGNPFDPDCYALSNDGTCINLPHTDAFVGITEAVSQFKIFPNPANDYITIQSKEYIDPSNGITITDVTGRVLSFNHVKRSDSEQILIDVSSFPAGLYTMTISFPNGSKSTKHFLKD